MPNFAGIGESIGAGFSQGLSAAVAGELANKQAIDKLKKQLEFLQGLDVEQRQLLGFGPKAPSTLDKLIALQFPALAGQIGMNIPTTVPVGAQPGMQPPSVTPPTPTGPPLSIGTKFKMPDGTIETAMDAEDLRVLSQLGGTPITAR
jgi:hypothetical protein